mgnify:CR=1 FL=1
MTTHDILNHLGTGTRHLLDLLSATVAVGVIVQILPPLAATMTIIWTGLQIFGWFEARHKRHTEIRKATADGLVELSKEPKL